MQSRVIVYGGAGWWGDRYEHYRRAVFFPDQLAPSTKFTYGIWSLPVREPPSNAAAALLKSVFGREFWVYQTLGMFTWPRFLPTTKRLLSRWGTM